MLFNLFKNKETKTTKTNTTTSMNTTLAPSVKAKAYLDQMRNKGEYEEEFLDILEKMNVPEKKFKVNAEEDGFKKYVPKSIDEIMAEVDMDEYNRIYNEIFEGVDPSFYFFDRFEKRRKLKSLPETKAIDEYDKAHGYYVTFSEEGVDSHNYDNKDKDAVRKPLNDAFEAKLEELNAEYSRVCDIVNKRREERGLNLGYDYNDQYHFSGLKKFIEFYYPNYDKYETYREYLVLFSALSYNTDYFLKSPDERPLHDLLGGVIGNSINAEIAHIEQDKLFDNYKRLTSTLKETEYRRYLSRKDWETYLWYNHGALKCLQTDATKFLAGAIVASLPSYIACEHLLKSIEYAKESKFVTMWPDHISHRSRNFYIDLYTTLNEKCNHPMFWAYKFFVDKINECMSEKKPEIYANIMKAIELLCIPAVKGSSGASLPTYGGIYDDKKLSKKKAEELKNFRLNFKYAKPDYDYVTKLFIDRINKDFGDYSSTVNNYKFTTEDVYTIGVGLVKESYLAAHTYHSIEYLMREMHIINDFKADFTDKDILPNNIKMFEDIPEEWFKSSLFDTVDRVFIVKNDFMCILPDMVDKKYEKYTRQSTCWNKAQDKKEKYDLEESYHISNRVTLMTTHDDTFVDVDNYTVANFLVDSFYQMGLDEDVISYAEVQFSDDNKKGDEHGADIIVSSVASAMRGIHNIICDFDMFFDNLNNKLNGR